MDLKVRGRQKVAVGGARIGIGGGGGGGRGWCWGGAGDQAPVRWDLLAHGVDTLAIYMGVSQIAAIRGELLRHGKPASTPVALIESGTTRGQRTFTCTLDDMHKLAAAVKLSNPALILVGEVVRVREQLQLFEHQAEVYYGS
nr:SAM-dependent methyltransferase [Paenibacillus rubinfantis]